MPDRTSKSACYPPISGYAIIGDCRSAGLFSRNGSLDWFCLPRFDSPSIFAAVPDAENGERFHLRPTGEFRTERHYLANTNVLETAFHAATGVFVLRDLMPVSSEEDKRAYIAFARVPEGLASQSIRPNTAARWTTSKITAVVSDPMGKGTSVGCMG